MVALGAVYEHAVETPHHEAWVSHFAAALRQGSAGVYVNFLGDEGEARVRDAYPGATWDRLTGFKARYDPTNLFRRNQNIPAAVESDSVKPNDYKEPARAGDAREESTIYETAEDLSELSELLDHSYARAGAHLRSLFTSVRRIPAAELAALLPGVQVLNLATVSRACAPRVAPVDGLLYRGRFWVGAAAASLRFSHLRERPQLSASHTRGEALAVIVHGTAALVDTGDPAHAGFADSYEVDGFGWNEWDLPVHVARIDPSSLYTYRTGRDDGAA